MASVAKLLYAQLGERILSHTARTLPPQSSVRGHQATCGARSRTTIQFSADDPNATVVIINEAKFPMDHEGVKRAMGQTAGWTYTLACPKAYLQFGINLRFGLNKRLTDEGQ